MNDMSVINFTEWKAKMKPDTMFLNKLATFTDHAVNAGIFKYRNPNELTIEDDDDLNLTIGTLLRIYKEEHNEFVEAVEDCHSPEAVTKELCDAIYTLLYFATVFKLPVVEAMNRICDDNIKKWEVGTVVNGKLVKPKDYPKLDLSDLFDLPETD